MEADKVKIVCIDKTNTPRYNITGVNDVARVAKTLKNMPGIGRPFMVFADAGWVPPTMVDFDLHPDYVVSADESVNAGLIEAMLADPPIDALSF